MSLKHLSGLDHVVLTVDDLDQAAEGWRKLGFTLSPRGTHSAHIGSGNYTIMLGPDYIELLGILTATPANQPTRDFLLRHGEGMERAAFTATDAAAGVEEIRRLGFAGTGPIDFGRPVALPSGGEAQARFRVFQWPVDEKPAGLRIFACQHLTPEAVWIPELQRHANTARRIDRVELLSADPQGAADKMARMIDRKPHRDGEDAWRVPSGSDRAAFVFLDRPALAQRHPGMPLDNLPDEGAATLALVVDDLEAAARAAGSTAIVREGSVAVPPGAANGIILAFEAEGPEDGAALSQRS